MTRIYHFLLLSFLTLWLSACGPMAVSLPPPVTPTLTSQADLGKEIFVRECASCHSLLEEVVIVGPSMKGIAHRAGTRVANQDARTYLMASILDPGGYVLEGYQNLMPTNFGKQLTGEEIDALIAYMLTLE
jgi:nitric oxide reductase subunit C